MITGTEPQYILANGFYTTEASCLKNTTAVVQVYYKYIITKSLEHLPKTALGLPFTAHVTLS